MSIPGLIQNKELGASWPTSAKEVRDGQSGPQVTPAPSSAMCIETMSISLERSRSVVVSSRSLWLLAGFLHLAYLYDTTQPQSFRDTAHNI